MYSNSPCYRFAAALICGAAYLLIPRPSVFADQATDPSDPFPSFESYIKVSGLAPWSSGNGAAFQKGTNSPTAGAGGIEDMFYTKDLTDNTTVAFQGKAMGGSDDYLAKFDLSTANVGDINIGYKSFRTFYDGIGGFFPLNDAFQAMTPERLHVDRGTFWADLKLARPDKPVFTLSFHDETRTGEKDSTIWGLLVNPLAPVVAGALVGTTSRQIRSPKHRISRPWPSTTKSSTAAWSPHLARRPKLLR